MSSLIDPLVMLCCYRIDIVLLVINNMVDVSRKGKCLVCCPLNAFYDNSLLNALCILGCCRIDADMRAIYSTVNLSAQNCFRVSRRTALK